MNDDRLQQLTDWVNELLQQLLNRRRVAVELVPVSGDASFRRYYRASLGDDSFIAVDAPPEHEDNRGFVRISNLLLEAGLAVPKVFSADYERGFMLLVDLGDQLYLPELESQQRGGGDEEVDQLYQQAIDALLRLQQRVDTQRLAPYDADALRAESAVFGPWFAEGLLDYALSPAEWSMLDRALTLLEQQALAQPQVAVHRDYHSRNLMLIDADTFGLEESLSETKDSLSEPRKGPGIIDFQDALAGPYSYDLVSLLRDCYIFWPDERVRQWCADYLAKAHALGMLQEIDQAQLRRDFDLMGLQRHLKVLGVFSRLAIRDKKPGYLADIPLVIRYFLEVSRDYPDLAELADLRRWFIAKLLPRAEARLNVNLERFT